MTVSREYFSMQKSNHQESGFAQGASLKVVLGHLRSLQELPQQGCPTLRSVVILSGEGLVVSHTSKSSVLSSAFGTSISGEIFPSENSYCSSFPFEHNNGLEQQ